MSLPFRPRIAANETLRRSEALFAWSARDGGIASLTGQVPTFVRATDRTVWDAAGKLVTVNDGVPGFDMVLNSVTGLYEPALLLEPTRTNLVLQSENFGTTWAVIGTPTRTAAAKTVGDLVLDLLGDDSATVLEGYSQTITFTGNAVKVVGIHLAAGTSTSMVLRLRDTTAAADRLLATITWAAGVPTVASVTGGVAIGSPRLLSDGTYLFEFQTGTVTAANVNSLQVYPATTAALAVANTGTVYAGGVYAYNADVGGTYVKTTTATVTHNRDDLSADAKWPMQDNETWYVRMPRPTWASLAGTLSAPYVLSRGATGPRLAIGFRAGTRQLEAYVSDGTTGLFSTPINIPAGTGGYIEFIAQFADLKIAPKCRIGDATGFAGDSPTGVPIASLTPTVVVGDAAWGAGNTLGGGLVGWAVVSGLRDLAFMQALV